MCGIAGVIDTRAPISEAILHRMANSIHHRGPDNRGVHCNEKIGLVHNRLSILDLSESGHQPMVRDDTVLVFNGEIYNYIELREELSRQGHQFRSRTDTEVLLAAYREWGEECVKRLRGMWAFAIYDVARGVVVLSRDRFGIKPLYYTHWDNCFLFGSEIKALLAAGVPARPNKGVWADYLVYGLIDHSTETFFDGIQQVPAEHNLTVNASTLEIKSQRYYSLSHEVRGKKATAESFEASLQEAIILHLRSDVPIGICLSGGLDSSTLAALAAPKYRAGGGSSMIAITARSLDQRDEGAYARLVSDVLGLKWKQAVPQQEEFLEVASRVSWFQEQPTGSPSTIMQHKVMELAAEQGLKVMLDGQGGDEILLGYERYYSNVLSDWFRQGRWATVMREAYLAVQNSRMTLSGLAAYQLYFQNPHLRRWWGYGRANWLQDDVRNLAIQRSSFRTEETTQSHQVRELEEVQLPHLLRYEDRNSMAFSIEARVPFVDHKVVEEALALPLQDKIWDGYTKYSLRTLCARHLPQEIAWRRDKVGFEAPLAEWSTQIREYVRKNIALSGLAHQFVRTNVNIEKLPILRVYSLFELLIWDSIFINGEIKIGHLAKHDAVRVVGSS